MTLASDFLENGYVVGPVESRFALDDIRKIIAKVLTSNDLDNLVGRTHDTLNDLRLKCIQALNEDPETRTRYYSLATRALDEIVGNELVMQKRINLSIQMPGDDSSLLPLHSDTWAGDSPYEVVLWVPLVDCYDTKAMFILPPEENARLLPKMSEYETISALFLAALNHLKFIPVKYGECMLFNPNLMHGNVVNRTDETRWSMNCRFKSLMSPYGTKRLGEFFDPISIKPATRVGMTYKTPRGFN